MGRASEGDGRALEGAEKALEGKGLRRGALLRPPQPLEGDVETSIDPSLVGPTKLCQELLYFESPKTKKVHIADQCFLPTFLISVSLTFLSSILLTCSFSVLIALYRACFLLP